MMRSLSLVSCVLIVCPAFAQTSSAVPVATPPKPTIGTTQPATPAVTPQDKIICRREAVTGSRARVRKICMTKTEWTKLWDTTRQDTSEMEQRNGRIGCINSAGSGVC